jgi:hypothetical protein
MKKKKKRKKKVKTTLKGGRFQDVKKTVTAELNAVPLDTFEDCFVQPFERSYKCNHERRSHGRKIKQIYSYIMFVLIISSPEL